MKPGPRALVLASALAVAAGAAQAPGDLDPTFGHGGRVVLGAGPSATAMAVLVQADGRVVAAGTSYSLSGHQFSVVRLDTDGALDRTFGGGDGVVTASPTGEQVRAYAAVLQADGGIVVAGQTEDPPRFAVARFLPEGRLDPDFGVEGWALTSIGTSASARGVSLQTDGKIVAAGTGTAPPGYATFGVVRYLADGTLDHGFGGGDGYASPPVPAGYDGASGSSMAMQGDGKIVVAGRANAGLEASFALARFWPDGSLDTSFEGDGWTIASSGSSGHANGVALQADGKIVAAGEAESTGGTAIVVGRFLTNGVLDPTFGSGGWVRTSFGPGDDSANAVLVAPNGKILAAGRTGSPDRDFALVRYRSNGRLDTTFGGDGTVRTSFGSQEDVAFAMAAQDDGRLVVAGHRGAGSASRFAVARYLG